MTVSASVPGLGTQPLESSPTPVRLGFSLQGCKNCGPLTCQSPSQRVVVQDSQSDLVCSCHVTSVGLPLECLHLMNIYRAHGCGPSPLLGGGRSEAHGTGLVSRNIPVYRTVNVQQRIVTKLRIHRSLAASLC